MGQRGTPARHSSYSSVSSAVASPVSDVCTLRRRPAGFHASPRFLLLALGMLLPVYEPRGHQHLCHFAYNVVLARNHVADFPEETPFFHRGIARATETDQSFAIFRAKRANYLGSR